MVEKATMNAQIVEAFKEIAREKNVSKESLVDIIESTFEMMIKKKYGSSDNFEIIVNMEKGEIEIFQVLQIVEEVEDPVEEIDLAAAQAIEAELEMGDEFVRILKLEDFGRRLIVAAKQNLAQRIKEAEKELIFDDFKNRVGEVIIGDVNQVNKDEIFINIDRAEVVMPRNEQIHNERYRRGDTIRAIIKKVERTNRGPEIVASRGDSQFLIRLFEIEVPEIYDGLIEIQGVAREPGDRAKVAVESSDKRIDAVGACVGMKGVRIQSIVKELNSEKIDIIRWNTDPEVYIAAALSPAKPVKVEVNREEKTARAIIPDDQVSLAIGRGGQNVRLASQLTGYRIEPVKESSTSKKEEVQLEISSLDIAGLTDAIKDKLIEGGYATADDVLDQGVGKLQELPGVGQKTAEKIIAMMSTLYEA
jgi:transcription termination/antitermination protein NusA